MRIGGFKTLGIAIACCLLLVMVAYSSEGERHRELEPLLTQFENYAEKARQDWKIPGMAVAIVQKDRLIYHRGFGVKQVGGKEKVDPRTIFQIGSTSKAFTSTLAAMQADEKKFTWDDRVIDHLPDFQMYDPWVTREFQIRDLMAQHSGLAAYSGDYQSFLGFDRQHIIHSLRYLPPITSFRSQFAYQNNLFLVVAALVEKYTGLSWEQNLERRIFQPLGMNDSSAGLEAFKATTNLAIPHTRENDKIIPLGKDWPLQGWAYIYGPAGGINSNVLDMARWLRFHLGQGTFEGKPLVSRENLVFTHSPRTILAAGEMAGQIGKVHPLLGDGAFYAQGWLYVYDKPYPIVWHNGGTVGCKSVVVFVPDADLGIVVLSNLGGTTVPEILAQWFLDHYFRTGDTDWNQIALDEQKNQKPTTTPTPAVATPALSRSAYQGIYTNDIYGEAIVSEEGGNLVVIMGPARLQGRLTHQNENSFLLQVQEDYGDDSNLTFTTRSGRGESFVIDALNTDGSGVFRRRD